MSDSRVLKDNAVSTGVKWCSAIQMTSSTIKTKNITLCFLKYNVKQGIKTGGYNI